MGHVQVVRAGLSRRCGMRARVGVLEDVLPILFQAAVPFDDDISATFIHRMILSDVNIYRYTGRGQPDVEVVDIYVGSRHEYEDAYHIRTTHDLTAATASST